jgi:hypothetical protein
MTQIKSIEHLIKECKDNQEDFFISFGFAKSSKSIEYISDQQEFYVINDIDGTYDYFDAFELAESNIGKAIFIGNFYKY